MPEASQPGTVVTVTGLKAERMLEIEGQSVVDGFIDGSNHLILKRKNNTEIDAGPLPPGPQGPVGDISVSPAGGDLSGDYPNPSIKDGAVTSAKVADALKDGAVGTATMRSLGDSAQQAAPGDHDHDDTGWVNLPDPQAGEAPFGTKAVVYAQYRKFGPMVHVRFQKNTAGAIDRSGTTGGNFPNVKVMGSGSVPTIACPNAHAVQGIANIVDSPCGLELNPDGSVMWTGGFARNYAQGSAMVADFFFMTSN